MQDEDIKEKLKVIRIIDRLKYNINELKDSAGGRYINLLWKDLGVIHYENLELDQIIEQNEIPFTIEELDNMTDEQIIELHKIKSKRLHPYCLIGVNIDDARKRIKEYSKVKTELLVSGKDGCLMDINTSYWYCNVDEHNNIISLFDPFENNV